MPTSDAARILRHGLRARILSVLAERGEASPADVATALGAPLGSVSYHTKVLREAAWIELARVERRRGGERHVYRVRVPPLVDDATWELLPLALRRGLTHQSLQRILRTAPAALRAGGFDHADAHVDLMVLRLSADGARELSDLLASTLERAQALADRGPAGGRPTMLVVLHYGLDGTPDAGERA